MYGTSEGLPTLIETWVFFALAWCYDSAIMWTRTTFRSMVPSGVIGMVHLRALPGSPAWKGDLAQVEAAALCDADACVHGGASAVMVENYGDIPFFKDQVPAVTVAAMTRIIDTIRRTHPSVPLGVNVLRNDVQTALAIAAVTDAAFVRVNVLTGAAVTDQGVIEGQAAKAMRLRAELCPEVGILADIRVKHAAPLAARPLTEEALDLRLRAGADALIVSGSATGAKTDPALLTELRSAVPDCPLLIGSGSNVQNLPLYSAADGAIVGSSLKATGPDGQPMISSKLVTAYLAAAHFTASVHSTKEADSP
jgi:uncharacterized protein